MKKNITRIAIAGAYGRMGISLITTIQKHSDVSLTCALVKKKKNNATSKYNTNVITTENLEKIINDFDVLIDFSTTQCTLNNLKICESYKKNIIIGTTGFTNKELLIIQQSSKQIGIVFSANFSIGVNIIFKLLKQAVKMIDNSYDIEILDSHHRNKLDSPSGTALTIGKIIAKHKNWNLKECNEYRHPGSTNPRNKNKIGFSSIRGGNTIGEHKIMFLGNHEKISIEHQANNRNTFSEGAIQAAKWVSNKKCGLFNMIDVLNI